MIAHILVAAVPVVEVKKQPNPFSVWGELLLRVDSMAMTGQITLSQATGLRNLVRKRDAQAADVYLSMCEKDDRELSSKLLHLLDPNKRWNAQSSTSALGNKS